MYIVCIVHCALCNLHCALYRYKPICNLIIYINLYTSNLNSYIIYIYISYLNIFINMSSLIISSKI